MMKAFVPNVLPGILRNQTAEPNYVFTTYSRIKRARSASKIDQSNTTCKPLDHIRIMTV